MRLATIRLSNGTSAALVEGEDVYTLPFADVRAVLDSSADWRGNVKREGAPKKFSEVSFAPLVPVPEKIVVVGWNYKNHVAEADEPMPKYPPLFAKYWRALIGAHDPVSMPARISQEVDPEVELGIVIGKPVYRPNRTEAAAAIGGYTIFNDMSVRDWQMRTPFPLGGKTWERMTPVGPVMVTPDEVDHAADLRVECIVDGFQMQDSRTSDMIFSPAEIVEYISTMLTLVPGDLISCGTPGGVGLMRKPPMYLKLGQTVTTRIEGLGELVNRCVDEREWAPAAKPPAAAAAR